MNTNKGTVHERSQLNTKRSPSPHSAAPHPASEYERFPSLDEARANGHLHQVASPVEITPTQATADRYKWPTRKSSPMVRENGRIPGAYTHRPRRSVSDAIRNLRERRGSVSENAQELAEALKAPVSYRLVALCIAWYMTSALTNTSSKSILTALPKPVTLTIVQFASVSMWCLILAYLASIFPALKRAIPALKNGILRPSVQILYTAMPLAIFQLLGHLLSSYATSKIPVSLVHTIKGLSPLFTVLAYRVVFRIRYARATYLSLIPLTVGVMLACSTNFSTNFWGISCAFVAAIVFVTQNIFSKKLFNEVSRAEAEGQSFRGQKLDKLNLLCYCSGGAFILTAPVWLLTEGFYLFGDVWNDGIIAISTQKGALDHGGLALEFVFNGIFHFGQNILAFVLLSMLSPVSYSVASLIKRVWVIIVAIIWFRSSTTPLQAFGVGLTFVGLYLYDRTSMEDAAERRAKRDHFRSGATLLPTVKEPEEKQMNGHVISGGLEGDEKQYAFPGDNFSSSWLPPGTKQETTWEPGDAATKY